MTIHNTWYYILSDKFYFRLLLLFFTGSNEKVSMKKCLWISKPKGLLTIPIIWIPVQDSDELKSKNSKYLHLCSYDRRIRIWIKTWEILVLILLEMCLGEHISASFTRRKKIWWTYLYLILKQGLKTTNSACGSHHTSRYRKGKRSF